MPEDGRRIYATHVGRFSRVIAAPLDYVYAWCTDYRTDDGKFSKSRPRFRVIRLSPDRVVRVRHSNPRVKPLRVAVEVVRLRPPNAWHVDQLDETDYDSVDYTLTRLGPRRTRISLVLIERWMVPKYPPKSTWVPASIAYWDGLVAAIEARYRQGRPARG